MGVSEFADEDALTMDEVEELAMSSPTQSEDWEHWDRLERMRNQYIRILDAVQPVLSDAVPRMVAVLDRFLACEVWNTNSACLAELKASLHNVRNEWPRLALYLQERRLADVSGLGMHVKNVQFGEDRCALMESVIRSWIETVVALEKGMLLHALPPFVLLGTWLICF